MKYIITESQSFFLRRLSIIDKLILQSLIYFNDYNNPKVDVDYMIKFLSVDVTELYFFQYAYDRVSGDDFDELHDFIKAYLNSEWREKIEETIIRQREARRGGNQN